MLKYKLVIAFVVVVMLAFISLGSVSTALTSSSAGPDEASSPATAKILKTVGIVKTITGTTLYLENNKKYDLRDVKVTQYSGKAIPNKKKKANMLFVNGVLKEVTIYY
ncbi:MAG: hypothetical protein WBN66_05980 [Smithella sp.]